MVKKPLVESKGAEASDEVPSTDPAPVSVRPDMFPIGGNTVGPIIEGTNLDKDGLRVAILKSDGYEIPYVDDQPPPPPNPYEVFLEDPEADEVLHNVFPFSVKVTRAVPGDYKVVLTTQLRSHKVVPGDAGIFGDLPIKFTN